MTRTVPPEKIDLPEAKSVKSSKINVPVDELHVLAGLNVRVDLPRLDELIASIEANGFYGDKPLAVYSSKDGYIVVDGHRRLAAVQVINAKADTDLDALRIATLPVVVKPTATGLAAIHIAQVQSASGEPLTMFEKGIAVRRIMADGMSKEDVARAFGVTTKTIDNYIAVASAPAKARDLLLDGKVKETHVLRALSKPDPVKVLQSMVKGAVKAGRAVARAGDAKPKPALVETRPHVNALDDLGSDGEYETEIVQDVNAPHAITIDADQALGPVLRQVAAYIRGQVPHDKGDDDTAFKGGRVEVRVVLDDEDAVPAELRHAIGDEL